MARYRKRMRRRRGRRGRRKYYSKFRQRPKRTRYYTPDRGGTRL